MRCWLWAILGLLVLAVPIFGEEISLPEGAVARLGLGWIGWGDRALAFSPDGRSGFKTRVFSANLEVCGSKAMS